MTDLSFKNVLNKTKHIGQLGKSYQVLCSTRVREIEDYDKKLSDTCEDAMNRAKAYSFLIYYINSYRVFGTFSGNVVTSGNIVNADFQYRDILWERYKNTEIPIALTYDVVVPKRSEVLTIQNYVFGELNATANLMEELGDNFDELESIVSNFHDKIENPHYEEIVNKIMQEKEHG